MSVSCLRPHWRAFALVAGLAVAGRAARSFEPIPIEGQTFIHDPSSIQKAESNYFIFGTGRGIVTKLSPDLIHWTNQPSVFEAPPAWTTNLVPGYRGYAWAPDVIQVDGKYYLYYSVSSFGKQRSAIGLATSPGLDASSTQWDWTDRGPVIQSTNGSPYNTIDPSVMLDHDGKLWMAFGSFWRGIYLMELDRKTGLRLDTNSAPCQLAWAESIEAACLTRHGEYYYLFVNWYRCCRGINSTYEVQVGRSKSVGGPYLDRAGINLINGGGTLFLESFGRFIGPGHIGIFVEGDTTWFSYHYYDAETSGRSRLALGQLHWTPDGWPAPTMRSDSSSPSGPSVKPMAN